MLRTGPVIALAALCGVCLADCGVSWWANRDEAVHSTFNRAQDSGYFAIPMTVEKAINEGWVPATQLERFNVDVYCMENNPSHCCIYNKKGIYSGFITSFAKQCVDATDYEAEKVPSWNKLDMMGHERWCVIVLTTHPDELRSGGEESCPRVGKGIYIVEKNGITSIPLTSPEYEKDFPSKGKCVDGQGNHAMAFDETSDSKHMHPCILLTDPERGYVTGVNVFFPHVCLDTQGRQWKEIVTKEGLDSSFGNKTPNGVTDGTALHVFMNRKPRGVICP